MREKKKDELIEEGGKRGKTITKGKNFLHVEKLNCN